MEQKRAWIYCRVAHNGLDSAEVLNGQRLRLESYTKEHSFEIVDSTSDIGSGLTMDRPSLLDFHTAAEDRKVAIPLVKIANCISKVMVDKVKKIVVKWHQQGNSFILRNRLCAKPMS